jgi:hypothetical protein
MSGRELARASWFTLQILWRHKVSVEPEDQVRRLPTSRASHARHGRSSEEFPPRPALVASNATNTTTRPQLAFEYSALPGPTKPILSQKS